MHAAEEPAIPDQSARNRMMKIKAASSERGFTQGLMVSAREDRIDTNCSLEGKMGIGKRTRIEPPLGWEPVHFLV